MSVRDILMAAAGVGGTTTDPNFKNVSLLLQGNTRENVTYAAFSDASTNNFAITPFGDARGVSFNPYGDRWSNFFDGSGDYLTLSSNASMDFGTGNFTIEGWFFTGTKSISVGASRTLIGNSGNSYTMQLYIDTNGYLTFGNTGSTFIAGSTDLANNAWHHFAISRSGTGSNQIAMWVDGARVAQGTNSQNYTSGTIYIGAFDTGNGFWNGYISNLRIVKGSSVYDPANSTITVSTTPLTAITNTALLTCQGNRFRDASSNAYTITRNGDVSVSPFSPFAAVASDNGSGFFDGSGDYLRLPSNSAFTLGSGDFIVEAFSYCTAGDNQIIYDFRADTSNTGFNVGRSDANGYYVFNNAAGVILESGAGTALRNTWEHIVVSRVGSTIRLFVNGVQRASATNTTNFSSTVQPVIGGSSVSLGDNAYNGYISNLRVVKGSGVSSVTVPSAPLTAVSGTSLLTLQSSNANQNIGFVDSSPNNFVITKNGNATQGSFSPYGSNWSNFFNGSNSSLSITNSTAFDFSGDFTAEGWFNFSQIGQTAGETVLFSSDTVDRFQLALSSTAFTLRLNGSLIVNASFTTSSLLGIWNHIAAVRSGSTVAIFVNGIRIGSGTSSASIDNGALYIGQQTPGFSNHWLSGYASNVRVIKGSGPYDATQTSLTVPTSPLTAITNTSLLTCQSNRFRDASSNNFSITVNGSTSVQRFSPFSPTASYDPATIGGSGYFDGSGDYLSVASNAAFGYGTGDFEISLWFYKQNAGDAFLIDQRTSDTQDAICLYITSNTIRLYVAGADRITSSTISLNNWNYLTVSRVSGTTKMFLNGVQTGSSYSDSTNYVTSPVIFAIRAIDLSSSPLQGYISSARIVKGSGVTSQTVPTAPLTAITNTSFLLNFTNAGVVDGAMMNNLETVGNARIVTDVKRYGTGSMFFDGSGDNLTVSHANMSGFFGTGDFTIECWLRTSITGTYKAIFCPATAFSASGFYLFIVRNDNKVALEQGDGTVLISSTSTVTDGNWHHVAVARSGTNTRIFVDGVLEATLSSDSYSYGVSSAGLYVGAYQSTVYPFNGYIDDLRITRGLARYTANFTPPSQALPNL